MPYGQGLASLGLQTVYRAFNEPASISAERFFLPDEGSGEKGPIVTYETGRPVSEARIIAFSVSHEPQLAAVAALLRQAGIDPIREQRKAADPLVLVGGPLTIVDPLLFHHLADAVAVGEGEPLFIPLRRLLESCSDKQEFLAEVSRLAGVYVPAMRPGSAPSPARADQSMLPAVGCIVSPLSELKDMFLVEAARGCPYACTFCVIGGKRGGDFRPVAMEKILGAVPPWARKVGLVGAAVTSHPDIEAILDAFIGRNVEVSVASLRADRLTPSLMERLKAAGIRTVTIAADGSSERMRERLRKGITGDQLLGAADLARASGFRRLKLYAMVGLPDEDDADLKELVMLCREMSRRAPLTVAVQAFVPKPGTPLSGFVPLPVPEMERRLAYLKKKLAGVARLQGTSAKWSWIEYRIAHAGIEAGLIAARAADGGSTLAAWKRALAP